ncbi:actin-related protein 8-like isoform X2 [Chenopodium quinoa]|uniref:actin-related protein 8-like isoform X2 n=1 Tax=Chenopodium quinoa TaxID=63459 RepID=UPI000B787B42|nr:actin-related protein 8-like isoform X2 [Chenopodium quinoa]
MLLRKVWESIVPGNSSSSNRNPATRVTTGIGSLDVLPEDVLGIILRKLGPEDAGKLCVVCRSWRRIVISDNRLWINIFQTNPNNLWDLDSIFFSEIQLPRQLSVSVSLMHLYGQRAKVPGAVIVDGGSGYCKFGWSKHPRPSGRSATFLEFGNIEAPMYSRLRHFYATIYSRMQVKSTAQPIVVSIPICHYDDTESAKASRRQLKGAIYSALFDMNVPSVCAINQATLALYAARRTSGIVVNIGFHQTSVAPSIICCLLMLHHACAFPHFLHGKIMRKVGVEVVGMGALKLTGFLREQMQQQNIYFESLYTVRELKENLCYVALDYEAELSKDTLRSYKVPREGVFALSKERFQTGEILFQPRLAGVRAMGLHQAVALCMEHCHAAELMGDDNWFKTVVLCGGTACLPGLAERLEKELHELLPLYLTTGISVIPPPHGVDSAWHGARLISNMDPLFFLVVEHLPRSMVHD